MVNARVSLHAPRGRDGLAEGHPVPIAVMFDVDGVSIAFVDLHPQSCQDALRGYGCDIPFDNILSWQVRRWQRLARRGRTPWQVAPR